jgi:uncharacterized lipoprotein YmbA
VFILISQTQSRFPLRLPGPGRAAAALLVLAAALLLGACGTSTPVRYYTLQDVAAGQAATSTAGARAASEFALQVQPVRLPAAIDQPQLLLRSSAGEVLPQDGERWLGPLADEIRAALVSQLTRRLRVPEVSALSTPADLPVYRLQIDVTRFDSVRASYVAQELNWSLRASAGAAAQSSAVLLCRSRQVVPVTEPSSAALVAAHQAALNQLAGQIAQVAAQPVQDWRCP